MGNERGISRPQRRANWVKHRVQSHTKLGDFMIDFYKVEPVRGLKATRRASATTALSLNGKPCAAIGEGVKAAGAILVSCVKSAKDTATQDYDAREIVESIRTDKPFKLRPSIERIRQTFADVAKTGDRKAAKNAVNEEKIQLPAVMWSGSFHSRKKDALDQHSGLLCADLDELGDQLREVRTKLLTSAHVWALFTSPTGDGLKCVFCVPADSQKHKASFQAVEKHIRDLTGVQIDQACSDVARLCFLSHDPDTYLNEKAIELQPLEATTTTPPATAALCGPEIKARQDIAARLLGEIDWKTETRGSCTCPGLYLHTTGDKASDCEVYLDGAPTLHCFHNHCQGLCEGANHELRSRIGKAEHAAKLKMQNGNTAAPTITPAQWFNEKFPKLYDQFGEAILEGRNGDGLVVARDIGEDFFAATLGDDGSPDAPTIYLPTEEKFYTYLPTDGIFVHQRDPVLQARLSRLLLYCARECRDGCETKALEFRFRDSQNLTGILKKARGLLAEPHDFFSNDLTEFIPCANGMLRLSDKTLLPFSPTYRRRNKLAVPYDHDAKCPVFLDTLMRPALDPDELDLLQRWCGLALISENLAQRILILIGTPGGGKGTFVRVLTGIIGQINIASLRPELLGERFEIGRFLGKTMLYGADVPENFLNQRGASVLKSLTGYDPVTLEFKNSNESPLITCRFNVIVTCNSRLTVHLEGDTEAWRRRLAIVEYHKAKPKHVIADLDRQILEKEASGVLNWMIEGLDKIRAAGWQLNLTNGQQTIVDNLLLESDAHNLFARQALVHAAGKELTVQDCFAAYVEFCNARGWTTLTKNKFSRDIGDVVARVYGITVRHDIKDANGKDQRGWKDLQLRDKVAQPPGQNAPE
jgi:P4 family phage/plasmid primase-like protien